LHIVCCRALLESDRAITQTNERTLIKQLGSWLGLLTFAKNKPVLAKDMDLKQLIADAYTRGRMIAVLPFVEKVLSGCKDTKVRGHSCCAGGVCRMCWKSMVAVVAVQLVTGKARCGGEFVRFGLQGGRCDAWFWGGSLRRLSTALCHPDHQRPAFRLSRCMSSFVPLC
jgi:hypothetical protein